MARLERLSPVKEVAQIGSAIGREFSYDLLAAVSELRDNELKEALGQLANAELVYVRGEPPDATYVFKHALVQDAAYASLLRARRQQIHARIAQVLPEKFPDLIVAAARNACASLRSGWTGGAGQGVLEPRWQAGAGERDLRRGNEPFRQSIGAGCKGGAFGNEDTRGSRPVAGSWHSDGGAEGSIVG